MTQSALSEAVGCKQSAISMLESGQTDKISQETVEKIAALLGIPLEQEPPSLPPPSLDVHRFCPNAMCYSNIPYVMNGELLFWPRPQPAAAVSGPHCAICGELLESRCPHCGVRLGAGACCPVCGGALVTNTLPSETDPAVWAEQRRREIAGWRTLLA